MATLISAIITQARRFLHEPAEVTNGMWTDAELLDHARNGVYDLQRAIKDNFQNYFFTVDNTLMSIAASATSIAGVPADIFTVQLIEPRDLATYSQIVFEPRRYTDPLFQEARSRTAQTLGAGLVIFYDITGAGGPVGAPTIYVAPKLSSALNLSVVYTPCTTVASANVNNPIPGQSDQALINWIVAFAKAKTRPDQEPDPDWLALYSTEKTNIQIALTPRQEQEVERVEGYLEGEGDWWY